MRTQVGFALIILPFLALSAQDGNLLGGLSAADVKRVDAGEQVLITRAIDGYPWPEAQIYQRTDLSPASLMAIFFDYNQAFRFVPNCKASTISKQITAVLAEVDYEVSIPIFPDEAYTAENALKRLPCGGYAVSWRVIRATSIESSAGSLYVEPHGDGSILRYTNLIKPASRAAGLLRGIMISQMKDTVQAIVDEAEGMRAKSPMVVEGKITAMETALNTP